ncbi:hypothetical protein ACFQAV_05805 [Companilactobacillus huachuanensis]|uniref:Uncharacterized protein n=1 Tax=Companilactobacillus huachuanensis TaxID=2559914 RepID=A0ABW1RLQ2_9LACO|nr:hypothetical protein [Companilactobacillus huachuanensis]
MALAITPRGEFGYLPNYGKDSNRGVRPWLTPVPIAELHFFPTTGGGIFKKVHTIVDKSFPEYYSLSIK